MDLLEAWRVFGRDLSAILAEAKSRPRDRRLDYIEELLEDATASRKRLQARHHPDRGGDPAIFRRVTEAYEVIAREAEEFRRAFKEAEAKREIPKEDGHVRIKVEPIE